MMLIKITYSNYYQIELISSETYNKKEQQQTNNNNKKNDGNKSI